MTGTFLLLVLIGCWLELGLQVNPAPFPAYRAIAGGLETHLLPHKLTRPRQTFLPQILRRQSSRYSLSRRHRTRFGAYQRNNVSGTFSLYARSPTRHIH